MEFGSMEKGRHEQHRRGPLRLAGTSGEISTTQNGLASGMEELVKSSNGTGSPSEELLVSPQAVSPQAVSPQEGTHAHGEHLLKKSKVLSTLTVQGVHQQSLEQKNVVFMR